MKYLDMAAEVSEDGMYRYWLSRRLSMGERSVLFVGLNPSTADAFTDDPTIRKCVGFARQWGFDWLYMGNLHAYRSTDPKGLSRMSAHETIGPKNVEALRWMKTRADLVVAAWGQNKLNLHARGIAEMVLAWPQCRTLGSNQDGTPKHPLYLPYTTCLEDAGNTKTRSARSPSADVVDGGDREKGI